MAESSRPLGRTSLSAESPDLATRHFVSDCWTEKTPSATRHTRAIAGPESNDVTLSFRSEDGACDGEPLVVCCPTGCELRQ